jgi:UDP-N-acetylmuramoyl-L-alanyl-D-glutamate--2,6-diaminopimelate ligase
MDIDGLTFEVRSGDLRFEVTTRLIGHYNLLNALAAIATSLGLGISPASIQAGFEILRRVPGRLDPVDLGQDFRVLIDYAHTDDALQNVLDALRPLTRGRILTVFGCGGDRDQSKRARMGRVATKGSDRVFITNDNPRSEDPASIAREIVAGVDEDAVVSIILDRREAIRRAIGEAAGGDIVLIAGKGHESVQLVGDKSYELDDRSVAEEVLWRLSR